MAKKPKVAIVHDWLVGGGAERVVLELHRTFPDAPIYTSYSTKEWRQKLDDRVVTGFLQHWPFSTLRKFIPPLRLWWFRRLDLSEYDIVISSSGNGEAKSVRVRPEAVHICYCHSPTHFYWRHYDTYMQRPGFGPLDPLVRLALRALVGPLRRSDLKAAQLPQYFIANSTHIKRDIKQYYGRDAEVIHPPVDIERFASATATNRKGFVTAGRQVPHKHTEIIIEACNRLSAPLTVIGRGPEHERLKALAGPTVTLLDSVTDEEMPQHFANAKAFLFASFEDFGVTPVEAMAAGTPVIALRAGGALDYVVEGKTGLFFAEQNADSLISVLESFQSDRFDHAAIQRAARQFSAASFRSKIESFVRDHSI